MARPAAEATVGPSLAQVAIEHSFVTADAGECLATKAMTRSGHARTTPTAAHESRPCGEALSSAAVPTLGAVALARRQPGGERIAGPDNHGFGDHNAFRRGTSTATIESVPSTTTPIATARTAVPARRVHRAMRVRATNAPARTRASNEAR